jgi:C-terminal processing protease CtpA/Prc
LETAHDYADVMTGGQGYLAGVPKDLYGKHQQAEQALRKAAGLKTDDQLRNKVKEALVETGSKEYQAVDEFVRAVVIGQQMKDWGAQAQDMYRRSQASWQMVRSIRTARLAELTELYDSSPVFKEKLPTQAAYRLGIIESRAKWNSGIISFANDPLFIVILKNTSFAFKLGFRSGDRIVSLAGRLFGSGDTVEDVKSTIMDNLGKQVEAVVERAGKNKTLKLKIPARIPEEFMKSE